jgi:hypothetical protein
MKKKVACFSAILFIFLFLCLTPLSASKTEGNRQLKSLIVDLEKKISDADKRMVAHPSFLDELRTLVEKYKSQLRKVFFKDNFKDSNYTQKPKWIVKSGHFFVNKTKRLSNSVTGQIQEPEKSIEPEKAPSLEEEAIGLLLGNIFGKKKENKPIEKAPEVPITPVQPAYIFTKTIFSPAFELNMEFISTSLTGEMEIVLLGTQNLTPRYRLNLKLENSKDKPIEILRQSNSRQFVVGAATQFPKINDGNVHVLKWIRFQDGAMHVLIDDKIVLKTYEAFYRDNFSGFGIENKGGAYEWASFKIYKALKPVTN